MKLQSDRVWRGTGCRLSCEYALRLTAGPPCPDYTYARFGGLAPERALEKVVCGPRLSVIDHPCNRNAHAQLDRSSTAGLPPVVVLSAYHP
jgi:hypothetical protein